MQHNILIVLILHSTVINHYDSATGLGLIVIVCSYLMISIRVVALLLEFAVALVEDRTNGS